MKSAQAAARLGIPHTTLKWYSRRFGVGRITGIGASGRVFRDFTDEDLQQIRETLEPPGLIRAEAVASMLKVSLSCVREHARELNIKPRPPFQYLYFTPDEIDALRQHIEQSRAEGLRKVRAKNRAYAVTDENRRHWRRVQRRNRLECLNRDLHEDPDNLDYHRHIVFYAPRPAIVCDPAVSSIYPDGPQTYALQWEAYYPMLDKLASADDPDVDLTEWNRGDDHSCQLATWGDEHAVWQEYARAQHWNDNPT